MKTEFILLEGEVIMPISGFEGLFAISSFGRVLSYPKVQNGWLHTDRKQIIDNRGYLRVSLGKDGIRATFKVHRIVAQHFIENPLNLAEVNHKDGDKFNNRVYNLEWATRKENMVHARDSGLLYKAEGSKNGFSILNEQQALAIWQSKLSTKELANEYNVSLHCIYDIKSGKSWKHVTSHSITP